MTSTATPAGPAAQSTAGIEARDRLRGIFFLSFGVMIFTVQDVIIKWISGDYAVTQILATRSLVAFVPLLVLLHLDGGFRSVSLHRLGRLLLRACLLFLSYTCYYLAIAAIPLAEAGSLFYTAPLFIVALSGPMLKERVGVARWLAVIAGFVGAIIMIRPGADLVDPAGLLSILSAATYALAQVMARDLGGTHRAAVMALSHNSVNFVAALLFGLVASGTELATTGHPSIAFLLRSWTAPTSVDLMLMAATGMIAAVAMWCLTNAYRIAEANVIAPFEYSSIVWLVLFGYVFWHEVPKAQTLVGGLLIMAAGVYVLRAAHSSGPPPEPTPDGPRT